ncbi:MAG: lysylphosphatidylglycerol synthase domain-containing protein, partial [Candidatus Binatia bacterium]
RMVLGIALVIGVGGMTVAALFWLQSRGMFSGLLGLLRRAGLRIRALEWREGELERIDAEIARFYREEPKRFFQGVAWHLVGWILGAGEIYFLSAWLGAPMSVSDAVAIEALAHIIKGVTFFVPGSIGFQESGLVFLYGMFALPVGAGAGVAVLRRARELFCAGVGFGIILLEGASIGELTVDSRAGTKARAARGR